MLAKIASLRFGRQNTGLGKPPLPPPPPPPPADDERGEKVSAQTLERLRSTFLSTASRGSVYDNYTLGDTLGAWARERWLAAGARRAAGAVLAISCERARLDKGFSHALLPAPRRAGTGGYAVVKQGVHKITGQRVAVKIMRLPQNGMLRGAHPMTQSKARAPRAAPRARPRGSCGRPPPC